MATFTGQLNANSVFAALYNMIISMQVFGTGIQELSGIYAKRRVDGTLFGDKKLYLSTDVLKSYAWDGTDTPGGYSLLTVKRPPAPVEEYIEIDTYRQIPVTVDDYLTKQAFMDEGAFSQFNGVVLSRFVENIFFVIHKLYLVYNSSISFSDKMVVFCGFFRIPVIMTKAVRTIT